MATNAQLSCTLQLGFDFNAPVPHLQYGLVDDSAASPRWLTDLPSVVGTDTTMTFALFDITSPIPVGAASASVSVSFKLADSTAVVLPLSPTPESGSSYSWTTDSMTSAVSAVFSGKTLNEYTSSSDANVFTLNSDGSFAFTIQATITPQDTSLSPQTFTLDPEMIVGGSDSPGPIDDGDKAPLRISQPERPAMNP